MTVTTYTGYIVEFISTSHDCKTPTLFTSLGDAMSHVHNVMAKQFNVTDFHVSEDELKPGSKWHCYFEGKSTPFSPAYKRHSVIVAASAIVSAIHYTKI